MSPEDRATALAELARAYTIRTIGNMRNNMQAALSYANESYDILTTLTSSQETLRSLSTIAQVKLHIYLESRLCEIIEVVKIAEKFIADAEAMDSQLMLSIGLNLLGDCCLHDTSVDRVKSIDKAIDYYSRSSEFFRVYDPQISASQFVKLADALMDRPTGVRKDNINSAILYYQKAIAFFEQGAFFLEEARVKVRLALAFIELCYSGDLLSAEKAVSILDLLWQSELLEKHDDLKIDVALNMAAAFSARVLGNHENNKLFARTSVQMAMDCHSIKNDPVRHSVALASLMDAQDIYDYQDGEFQDILETTTAIFKKLSPITNPLQWGRLKRATSSLLAHKAYKGCGEFQMAIHYVEEGLKILNRTQYPLEYAFLQGRLANIYFLWQQKDSQVSPLSEIQALKNALSAFTDCNFPLGLFTSNLHLGRCYALAEDWSLADQHFQKAIECYSQKYEYDDDELFHAFTEKWGKWELSLVPVAALMNGDIKRAILRFEQMRASSLKQALTDKRKYVDLEGNSISKSRLLHKTYQNLDDFSGKQRQNLVRVLEIARNENTNIRAEKIEDILNSESIGSRFSWVFVPLLSSDFTKALLIPPRASINDVIVSPKIKFGFKDLISLLTSEKDGEIWVKALSVNWSPKERQIDPYRVQQKVQTFFARLYEAYGIWIKQTLDSHITNEKKSLVIVPTGLLSFFPLGAAGNNEDECLLKHYTISYSPSISALREIEQKISKQDTTDRLLSLLSRVDDKELRAGHIERANVTAYFGEDKSIVISGEGLNKENVENILPTRNYWHISTHGYFDFRNVLSSHFELFDKNIFYLSDFANIHTQVPVRLAVLSACQSGLPEFQQRQNEFISFPEAFMKLGVSAVIAAQWPVQANCTAVFFDKFYELHLDNGKSPAASLCETQQWIKNVTAIELMDFIEGTPKTDDKVREAINEFRARLKGLAPHSKPFNSPVYWGAFVCFGR